MEKILEIKEIYNHKINDSKYSRYDGYIITTNKQSIFMGIDNSPQCCENWGYLISNNDFIDFIGTELLKIEIADTELNIVTKELEAETSYNTEYDETNVMFINIYTKAGMLQFAAYNDHNGYYGHEAVVISNDFVVSEGL